jgi:hypothetical protein
MTGLTWHPLESNLKQPVRLIFRGEPDLRRFAGFVPPAWENALMSAMAPGDAVEALWQPVTERARGFVVRLATITLDLALAVSPEERFLPSLFYITQSDETLSGWYAGQPADTNQPASTGVILPRSYKLFARVHNGFLWNGDRSSGFFPLEKLALDPAETFTGIPDDPRYLPFCGIGGGKTLAYDLASPTGKGDYLAVMIDPASGQISTPRSFWSALKDFTITRLR